MSNGSLTPWAAADSQRVERVLSALAVIWGDDSLSSFLKEFPLGEKAVLELVAASTICSERLQRDPDLLRWLGRSEISASDRGPRRMRAELQAFCFDVTADNFRGLRQWKGREMTRLALREVANVATLEQTTLELSYLAEICLAVVVDHLRRQLESRYGKPSTEFTVLGLGKLGGRELNHSSDIDLMIFYGVEGEISARMTNHLWHNRLAESLVKIFNASDRNGALFRIDLRLRPEGTAGPLTRSLESAENYYSGFGETWERLALIKARCVGGNEELAYDFLRQHQPFIFPRSPTPELFEEMATIKRRIEREVPADEFNVKLGAGGIREIEFVTQALQFLHGARHAFLQDPSTLKALHAIAQLELLPVSDAATLDRTYRLLRRVEHFLQIDQEQQTHSLPHDETKRQTLARNLGFGDFTALQEKLGKSMAEVRQIFRRVIATGQAPAVSRLDFFTDPPRAEKTLAELGQSSASFHVAPRTRQIFRKLHPLLLAELARVADPDATLVAVLRFVEAFGMRGLLFELLTTNPRLLELLVKIFDASDFAAQLLVRRPNWLEEITRSSHLSEARTLAQHREFLARVEGKGALDEIRGYRQMQLLRIIIRDVMGFADLPTVIREQSDLAEACLLAVNDLVGASALTIVAMGKFGGRELGYGSDLDLMFVGAGHRAAQNVANALAAPSGAGQIASVDLRLRPEGDKGPLVASTEAFANYYRDRAQFWEVQALTRARVVTGPDAAAFNEIAHAAWAIAGRDRDLFAKIDAMLVRIRNERGSGNDFVDFKTGVGGLVAAEFMVQGLQMHHDVREVSTLSAIKKLSPMISNESAKRLGRAYEFLRRCEIVLRRRENKSEDVLPGEEKKLGSLVHRMGFETVGTWRAAYEEARSEINALYQKHFVAGK